MKALTWACSLIATLAMACGGTAVIDASSSAGGGNGNGSGGASTECARLNDDLAKLVNDSRLCDPAVSIPQCSTMTLVQDNCGCDIVANDLAIGTAHDAQDKFVAYETAGCVAPCTSCPVLVPVPCVPDDTGTDGHCATQPPP
jgi:hypothetical protein